MILGVLVAGSYVPKYRVQLFIYLASEADVYPSLRMYFIETLKIRGLPVRPV